MRSRSIWSSLLVCVALAQGCVANDEPTFRRSASSDEAPLRDPASATPAQGIAAARPAPPESPPTAQAPTAPTPPALLQPASLTARAPARFTVALDTTEGEIRIDVTRAWSPNGADRIYNLVRAGYFSDVAFFRVIQGFMAQCGIHGDPAVNTAWRNANIPDDPVREHNTRGAVSFAMAGPGTRTTQFFINFGDNTNLDDMGFAPFGRVQPASMAIVDRLFSGYGEGAPSGRGPAQGRMQREGNTYLRASFPELDYIRSARIVD